MQRAHGDRRTRVRGAGWERVHVAVDGTTRLAYVEVHPGEHRATCVQFLIRGRAWFAARGVQITRILTDNGSAYRSHQHREVCAESCINHSRPRPYRPQVNGKAQRFVRTLPD